MGVLYEQVARINKLSTDLENDNYATSSDVTEQAERLEEVAELATSAAALYRGIEKVLS